MGYPHEIKGQGIYAYVTLKVGVSTPTTLKKELIESRAQPDRPDRIAGRSSSGHRACRRRARGKIMRRILRKIAENEIDAGRRHQHAGRSLRRD